MVGISAGLLSGIGLHIPLAAIIVIPVVVSGLVFIKFPVNRFSMHYLTGFLILCFVASLVYEITIRKNEFFRDEYFIKHDRGKVLGIGSLAEPPIQKSRSTKILIHVESVYTNETWKKTTGEAVVYLKKDHRSEGLFYGDRILFQADFKPPDPASFPGSFDQKKYLNSRQIFHVSYINSGYWKKIPSGTKFSLLRMALSLRTRMLQILRDNEVKGREFAVTAALLLGYVDEIDRELMSDYSATGAMHILSVSGMHVGIIFLVLDKLLGFLRKPKYGMVTKTVLIILTIWFYAMITGLSPAVLRASVMITLVVTGKALKRQPDILNILAASFIFLLISEPTLLFNIGFQMSYLAVAGIVVLYKPVYDIYITSNLLLDRIWSVVAVSIAAQISTFPLSLYYFHQFPNFFMITNILVVPLSTLIIYSGILLLIFGSVPVLSFCLAKLLIASVWFLNNSIHFMEGLPFAVTRGVYISTCITICIYLIIIMIALYIFYRRTVFIFIFLLFAILITADHFYQRISASVSPRIIFYDSPAYDFISEGKSVFLYHPETMKNVFFRENHPATYKVMKVNTSVPVMLSSQKNEQRSIAFFGWFYKKGDFIRFYDKKIFVMNKKLPGRRNNSKLMLDYLIITGNPPVTIDQICEVFEVKEIISDPSNLQWRSEKWKKEAIQKGIKLTIVKETGTVVKEIK